MQSFKVTVKKLKNNYTRLNKKVFYGHLPPSKEINFIVFPKNDKIIAETYRHYYNENVIKKGKNFSIVFYTNEFKSRKLFLEILVHEMVHIVESLEHGVPLGHGKHFFKWKERLSLFGFNLEKTYKI